MILLESERAATPLCSFSVEVSRIEQASCRTPSVERHVSFILIRKMERTSGEIPGQFRVQFIGPRRQVGLTGDTHPHQGDHAPAPAFRVSPAGETAAKVLQRDTQSPTVQSQSTEPGGRRRQGQAVVGQFLDGLDFGGQGLNGALPALVQEFAAAALGFQPPVRGNPLGQIQPQAATPGGTAVTSPTTSRPSKPAIKDRRKRGFIRSLPR